MKKALIRTGYSCNNNCVFCHMGLQRHKDLTTSELKSKILYCKKQGYDFVVLSGGEPTIRKDLVSIAQFMKQNNMYLGLITNGRMFSYSPLVEKLVQNNLKYVYISLLGSTKEIQESITNSGGFEQTIQGIKNVVKYKSIEHKINVTVLSKNINDLKNIVDLSEKLNVRKLKFSPVDYKGEALKNLEIVPDMFLAIKKIKKAVDYAVLKQIDAYIGDFPLCLIEGYSKSIDNLETNEIEVMSEVFEDKLYLMDHDDKIKPADCVGCEKYNLCSGIDKNYIKIKGNENVIPPVKKGNSIPFKFIKESDKIDCASVPRDIKQIVFHQGKIKTYGCESNNFTEQFINHRKNISQVYISKNELPYSKSYLKLTELDKCRNCDEKNNCARIFVPNVKKTDSDYLEDHLKKLNGEVLDIGCGDIPFRALFLKLVNKMKINYTGIDPVSIRGEPEFKMITSRFEDSDFENEFFDNILLLGSYNHLYDLKYSLEKIFKILKKKGSVIISDDEVPIFLENKKCKSSGTFEHYRNHTVLQAISELKRQGFEIITYRDVSDKTDGKWVVIGRK